MLKIVKHPDPILREKLPLFDFENLPEDPVELETQMLETMWANNGIGLSANQVGKRFRMFVMGYKDGDVKGGQAFFNPEIVANTESVLDLPEGCLSFPNIYVSIKRPKAIKVRWQNNKGEWQEGEFGGYDCKCFLHELDHLEGITFQDRVSQLKWALAVKKTQKRKY